MRLHSVFVLVCPCGREVEIPDSQRVAQCACGRTLVVEANRNEDVKTVENGLNAITRH